MDTAKKAVVIGLAILGGILIAAFTAAEALNRIGYRLGPCEAHLAHGVPWGVFVLAAVCVLPITVSPGAARLVVEGAVNLIPGRRRADPPPPETGGP